MNYGKTRVRCTRSWEAVVSEKKYSLEQIKSAFEGADSDYHNRVCWDALAERLDPPEAKLDRSLRGPVLATTRKQMYTYYYIAKEDGLYRHPGQSRAMTWNEAKLAEVTVRPFIRRPDQWISKEFAQLRYVMDRVIDDTTDTPISDVVDLVLDIALGEPK